jgi:hypothetical protein
MYVIGSICDVNGFWELVDPMTKSFIYLERSKIQRYWLIRIVDSLQIQCMHEIIISK